MGIETRRGVPASFCLRPARRRAQSGAFLHHIGQPSWAAGSIWCIFAPHRPTLEDCRPIWCIFAPYRPTPKRNRPNLVHFCTTTANPRAQSAQSGAFLHHIGQLSRTAGQSGAFLHHIGQPPSAIGPIWCIFAPQRPTLEPNRPNLVHFCTTSANPRAQSAQSGAFLHHICPRATRAASASPPQPRVRPPCFTGQANGGYGTLN